MRFGMFKIGSYYKEIQRFYGSKLHIAEQGLILLISYDDLTEEEVANFCKADIEITFKMFELISVFTFKFQETLELTPFNLFDTVSTWRNWQENKNDLLVEVVICDCVTGVVCGKRVERIQFSYYEPWLRMLNHFYEQDRERYNRESFHAQLGEIYDNHTIDEIYEMQENQKFIFA